MALSNAHDLRPAVAAQPSGGWNEPARKGEAVSADRYDVVVFDLGGVLIDWDPRYLYRRLLNDDAAVEEFLVEVDFDRWNHEQDAGRSFVDAVEAHARVHPHRRELLQAYADNFGETLAGDVPETVAVLADVRRAGRRVLALTNWSHETFAHARARFGWLGWFEGIVVSGEERVAKPDPRIFRLLAERYDVDPARAVYIDDNERNVRAAAAVGFAAIHYNAPGRLRGELVARGVLAG
jgi:2-haloacid dehalogenase